MKIENFDKRILQMLREDIDAALKTVGEKYGIDIAAANASYNGNTAHFKLEMVVSGLTLEDTVEGKAFTNYAKFDFSPLQPEWLGKSFSHSGGTYKIVGYNNRATKRPIKCTDLQDQTYNFPVSIIVEEMGKVGAK